jgi:hypothetical protein
LTADALNVSAASPNIDVTDTGTSHASQDFLTNSNAVRATIGVERSAGGGLFVGSSPYAAAFGTASAGATEFATNNNVRMRIDSSGNLLVGKTALGIDTNGFDVRPTGETGISVDSNIVLDLNRTTNDGKIINLRKDDTTVGSIGAYSGSPYIGADDTGISFFQGVNAVVPFNTATVAEADNSIDLGRSAGRFKDLYLSGGVYLGGTGSANKLDDYEEGTFTPSLSSGYSSASYYDQVGRYTKIGNTVRAFFRINLSSATALGTNVQISGFPFTSTNSSSPYITATHYINTSSANGDAVKPIMFPNGTTVHLYYQGTGGVTGLTGTNLGTGLDIIAQVVYETA